MNCPCWAKCHLNRQLTHENVEHQIAVSGCARALSTKTRASYTLPLVTKQHRKTDDLNMVVHRDPCCLTCVSVQWCTCVCLCMNACVWFDQEVHSSDKFVFIAVLWCRMCCKHIICDYPSCTSEHENTFRYILDCPKTWSDFFATTTFQLHCLFCGPLFLIHLLGRATTHEWRT